MGNPKMLDEAVTVMKQATDKDNAGDYRGAYEAYKKAVPLFLHLRKYETNPRQKVTISNKATEIIDRLEALDQYFDQEEGKSNGSKENGAAKANGAKNKSNGGEELDADTKKLQGALAGAILTEKPNIRWEDVAGLEGAKEALKEAVILPIKFPHLFTGNRKPWKGILLYGPPGTGKSYLAKAVATEANSTFFSVSSSDLVSKWLGESERLVKQLFNMARENRPSIVFIDEIDALCGPRGEGESEASRRIKTEILVQLDGVGKDMKGVLILGATNIPWQLDAAIRRRFQRRVHIGLPDLHAREYMFGLAIGDTPCQLTQEDKRGLAVETEGYSGSDITNAVQDALMAPVRKIQMAEFYKKVVDPRDGREKLMPTSETEGPDIVQTRWMDVEQDDLLEPPLDMSDFRKALRNARKTVSDTDLRQIRQFTEEFGSEGS